MDYFYFYILGLITGILFTIAMWLGVPSYKDKVNDTLNICIIAKTLKDGNQVDKCAELQEETKTEFICNLDTCWLEIK